MLESTMEKHKRLGTYKPLGLWWHIGWYWRNRICFNVVYWWRQHPWRSALWKAHYSTHTGYHPWAYGPPLGCRYCTKSFWKQNRHLRGQKPHPPLFASTEIQVTSYADQEMGVEEGRENKVSKRS